MTMKTRITTRSPRSSIHAWQRPGRGAVLAGQDDSPGEDPRFIARRIVICAAEDVGLADPMALVLANTACKSRNLSAGRRREFRWPKRRSILPRPTKATVRIWRLTPRSKTFAPAARCRCRNICGTRITRARTAGSWPGLRIRARPSRTFVAQDYLGADKHYYEPTEQGVEKKIKERVEKWRAEFTRIKNQNLDHG